jgi:erythronate-4-phosphate dehydrogenase
MLQLYDPAQGLPDLDGASALLVRTVSKLNAQTLPNIPKTLTFIGTGSSGTDHLDREYLEGNGVTLASSTGCNARSVAEYIMTGLLLWREKNSDATGFGKVGVIGVGKAGSAVSALLGKFGIERVEYDPPRERRDLHFTSASLDEVLACDILTFHVPLTKKGTHPTYHWLNEQKLGSHNYRLVINASRGGVVDEAALLKQYKVGNIGGYLLDVWEAEPDFNPEMAKHAFIATPHIAGYSEQAKINATQMICDQLAAHFGLASKTIPCHTHNHEEHLAHNTFDLPSLITRLHPIMDYDKALRDLSQHPDKVTLFQNLRVERPYRYEYRYLKIRKELLNQFDELKKLGIQPS